MRENSFKLITKPKNPIALENNQALIGSIMSLACITSITAMKKY